MFITINHPFSNSGKQGVVVHAQLISTFIIIFTRILSDEIQICIYLEEKYCCSFHFSKVFRKGSAFLAVLLKNKKQICYYALELHFKTRSAVFGSISMEVNS